MNKIIRSRIPGIDVLKSLCCLLIISIHAPFQGAPGSYCIAFARVAVPIFFMITGFFYYDTMEYRKELFQIKKMAILCFWGNFLYFLWGIVKHLKTGVLQYIFSVLSPKPIIKFLFLNESPFGDHLWYLSAILYALIIVYFLKNLLGKKAIHYLFLSIPILLAVDLIFGKYSLVILHREYPYIFVRNFAFVGLPYFSIGLLIKESHLSNLSKLFLWIGIIIFSSTTILEKYLLVKYEVSATREHYISTTFLSILIFILFLRYIKETDCKTLQLIGRNYSTMIYIIHPILITVIGTICRRLKLEPQYLLGRPIIIFVVSLLVCILLTNIWNKIRYKRI